MNGLMISRKLGLSAQHIRELAECNIGACETFLYEALTEGDQATISYARKKIRAIRKELRRAIDSEREIYERERAIEEELDKNRKQRAKRKAALVAA
ncbi:hypothetical protein [Phyllobacterium chamaecytisi]|uniref:hypothetical protein n=1 Tax=Phyllobacterium chamaecytisi TaxID=2876082 RepID=UPI001CCEFC10|nr:hypothetical protein [Phyllobacterium sp. KW56]MBZ9600501.1 hypothetical protein [Phyllobacterium sp. KW56]